MRWEQVDEFDGYFVSDSGLVKSIKRGRERVLRQFARREYLQVRFQVGRVRYYRTVHRLVALAFIPNPLDKPQVNHRDGVKLNNDVSNLEWATAAENVRHAYATGLSRAVAGETHHSAKLTDNQVVELRYRFAAGESMAELAEVYGLEQRSVHKLARGCWRMECGGPIAPKQVAVLSMHEASEIRQLFKAGAKIKPLAKQYGVSRRTIQDVVRYKRYVA